MNNKVMGVRRCTWVYLVLMFFSFITYFVGRLELSGLTISLFVLLLALIKGQLVGAYFMGLGRLRGLWRWPVFIWLFIPGTLISIAFYLSA
ncbi:MAG: O-succinylhomoserine sulfhydrylase [Sedimenticola sp.]|jgi:hypothetical protein|nr:MAG: O-succinylhomoserine sulfhydrylase [Sedimenticola sp.]